MVYHMIPVLCFFAAWFMEQYAMMAPGTLSALEKKQRNKKMERHLYILVVLYMIFICGFRAYGAMNHIGIDTYGYYQGYRSNTAISFFDIFNEDVEDKGYVLLTWCFAKLGVSFTIFLLIAAVSYIGVLALYIHRCSKSRWMSLFVFVGMGLYFFAFSTIRQSIAMGICMGAYMLSQKVSGWKGFLGFAVLVWIASTIHASAIVFLPAYFLEKLPYRNITVIFMLAVAAITMLFKNQLSGLLMQLAIETSDKYENYAADITENAGAGMMLYLFVLATVVLRLLVSGGMSEIAQKDNSVYFLLVMLILFPAVQSGGAMMRIYYYYYMFLIVYLPNTLESIGDRKTKQLAHILLTFFLIYYYSTTSFETMKLLPYHFFWQG